MNDNRTIYEEYGIFSIKNSKTKSFGKIKINEIGEIDLYLMENLATIENIDQSIPGKLSDGVFFGKIKDTAQSIIAITQNTFKTTFRESQNYNVSHCLVFENSINRYNSYYEKNNATSMTLDISSCLYWFPKEFSDGFYIKDWNTPTGKIKIIFSNKKLLLSIDFLKRKNYVDCLIYHKNIIRFIVTFLCGCLEINFPEITYSNREKAIVYHREQHPIKDYRKYFEEYTPLHYDIIGEKLGFYLSKYLENYSFYNQSYYLYTFNIFQKASLEHQFSTLAWGFEVLMDKRFFVEKENISTEERELIDSCLNFLISNNCISGDKRKSWRRKLLRKSAKTLGEKIEYTILYLFPALDKEPVKNFSISYSDMRNDISHRGGIDKLGNQPNYENMQVYMECVRFFYLSLLMLCIGIHRSDIEKLFKPYYHLYKGCDKSIRALKKEKILKSI